MRLPGIFLAAVMAMLCLAACPVPSSAMDAQGIFAKAKASVVVVYALDPYDKVKSLGSGFFIEDGDIVVTNYHVIDAASSLKIKLIDGTLKKVLNVKSVDKKNDLALLRVDYKGAPLTLSGEVAKVGQEIVAIGNPQGLERTLSTGVVSGIRQTGLFKKGVKSAVYQVTAPSSQGSSGGPVLNAKGEVVGVTVFGVESGQNLNFAVPVDYVVKLLGGSGSGDWSPAPLKDIGIQKDDSGAIHIFERKKK